MRSELGRSAGKRRARPRANAKRYRVAALAAAGLGLSAIAVVAMKRPAADASTGPQTGGAQVQTAQLVTAIPVAMRQFVRTAPVSGQVRPYRDIQVFAPAPGVRIAEIMAEFGDVVTEGQPLARLDVNLVDAQMNEAEAQVRQASIEQKRTADEFARIDPIADEAALSKEEVATRRAAADTATAKLAVQKAALAQLEARMQGGYVRSPSAGLVIERNARVGEFADQQALFRIAGENRLEVAAEVSETDILSLQGGDAAVFTTADGKIVEAVLRVPPVSVDPQSRTGVALFDLPADAGVRVGMYLRGEVTVERSTALAAPFTAISYASGEPCIFVISDGTAHLTPVTLGPRTGGDVAILSGLKEGDLIASMGGAFLIDGDAVRTAAPEAANDTLASMNR